MKTHRAFSLVELLVVIAIIALLVGVLLPSLSKARNTARLRVCDSGLKSLAVATASYEMQFRNYPNAPSLPNPTIEQFDLWNKLQPFADLIQPTDKTPAPAWVCPCDQRMAGFNTPMYKIFGTSYYYYPAVIMVNLPPGRNLSAIYNLNPHLPLFSEGRLFHNTDKYNCSFADGHAGMVSGAIVFRTH